MLSAPVVTQLVGDDPASIEAPVVADRRGCADVAQTRDPAAVADLDHPEIVPVGTLGDADRVELAQQGPPAAVPVVGLERDAGVVQGVHAAVGCRERVHPAAHVEIGAAVRVGDVAPQPVGLLHRHEGDAENRRVLHGRLKRYSRARIGVVGLVALGDRVVRVHVGEHLEPGHDQLAGDLDVPRPGELAVRPLGRHGARRGRNAERAHQRAAAEEPEPHHWPRGVGPVGQDEHPDVAIPIGHERDVAGG